MKNKLTVKITKCDQCAHSRVVGIWTSDSFEHVSGVYCQKKKDRTKSWERHTVHGYTDDKLVCSDDWDPTKYAFIPDWCPLLVEKVREISNKADQYADFLIGMFKASDDTQTVDLLENYTSQILTFYNLGTIPGWRRVRCTYEQSDLAYYLASLAIFANLYYIDDPSIAEVYESNPVYKNCAELEACSTIIDLLDEPYRHAVLKASAFGPTFKQEDYADFDQDYAPVFILVNLAKLLNQNDFISSEIAGEAKLKFKRPCDRNGEYKSYFAESITMELRSTDNQSASFRTVSANGYERITAIRSFCEYFFGISKFYITINKRSYSFEKLFGKKYEPIYPH